MILHIGLGEDDEQAEEHDDFEDDEHEVGHHGDAAAAQVLAHLGEHATRDQDVEHHARADDDLALNLEDPLRMRVRLKPLRLRTDRRRLHYLAAQVDRKHGPEVDSHLALSFCDLLVEYDDVSVEDDALHDQKAKVHQKDRQVLQDLQLADKCARIFLV